MTLRRRLTAAAALAVAAVAMTLGVVGYLTTRSHLVSELQSELHQRAAGFLQPHNGRGPDGGGDTGPRAPATARPPPLPQTGDGHAPARSGLRRRDRAISSRCFPAAGWR